MLPLSLALGGAAPAGAAVAPDAGVGAPAGADADAVAGADASCSHTRALRAEAELFPKPAFTSLYTGPQNLP